MLAPSALIRRFNAVLQPLNRPCQRPYETLNFILSGLISLQINDLAFLVTITCDAVCHMRREGGALIALTLRWDPALMRL